MRRKRMDGKGKEMEERRASSKEKAWPLLGYSEVWRSSNRIIPGNYETARSATGQACSRSKVPSRVMQIAL
ncbi:hypothetical protein QLX08_001298 [Tetragonisca angustula]|uniref:Uncharacterized protein n=1 Tax=Tetragonisca angustula TaxID=166442 RepID=A0AAW1AFV1_9HYME